MKVRCVDQSVRIRLRKSDIVQLLETGLVQVQLKGPGTFALTYLLRTDEGDGLRCLQHGTQLSFILPAQEITQWANSNEVSIERILPTTDSDFHFLLEKDFPCKDRPDEDKSDFFTELSSESPTNC
ncbi:MAG: hypothetical protein AAGH79_13465 [Bacteroidota bacterium]